MAAAVTCCGQLSTEANAGTLLTSMGFWNTGVDANSAKIGFTTADSHYTGTSGSFADTNPTTVFNPTATAPFSGGALSWVTDGFSADSRWITTPGGAGSSAPQNIAPGTFDFSLALNTVSSLVSVTGRWASDNDVEIFLNGVSTGVTRQRVTSPTLVRTFDTFQNFTVGGFNAGSNLLTFRVTNGFSAGEQASTMGLRVEFLSANVPEPSSFLACGGLVAGYLARRRARRKQAENSLDNTAA
ncbi:MAG: PEP-CTERM sorting domain-containing protein [Planctomycetota bacterium]